MKVIVAGSRNINNYEVVRKAIDSSCFGKPITEIVSGRAKGVDRLGERWADKHNIPIKPFSPDWNNIEGDNVVIGEFSDGKKYNKLAGINRNKEMGQYADALIAVWDGQSKGTKDMIDYMNSLKKPVICVYYHEEME